MRNAQRLPPVVIVGLAVGWFVYIFSISAQKILEVIFNRGEEVDYKLLLQPRRLHYVLEHLDTVLSDHSNLR